jgi:hypothetical protein
MKSKTEIVKPQESVKVKTKEQVIILCASNVKIDIKIEDININQSFILNIKDCNVEVVNKSNSNNVYVMFYSE